MEEEEYGPLVPANIDIEQSVIGTLMLDFNRVSGIARKYGLKAEWFFSPEAKATYEAIEDLHRKGAPVDILSVTHYLRISDKLDGIGELFTEGCIDKCITQAHAEHYIEVLRDMYLKREILLPALKKSQDLLRSDESAMDIITNLKSSLDHMDVSDPLVADPDYVREKVLERRAQACTGGYTGIPSKWARIQEITGGYRPGKMCLYGARPSVGKTTIALNEARFSVTKKNPIPTSFISLETDCEEIYEQLAAEHAKIDLHKYYTGKITDKEQLEYFDGLLEWYFRRPFYPTDQRMDIDQVCWTIQHHAMKYGVRFAFVDYIQIISDNHVMKKMRDSRHRYEYCSKRLFDLFRQTGVAGVVLAQLNREADLPMHMAARERWKFTPQLKHLKETGALEQDAYQAILFCPDPEEDHPDSSMKLDILANVAKNKRGPKGKVFLSHIKQEQAIETSYRSPGSSSPRP